MEHEGNTEGESGEKLWLSGSDGQAREIDLQEGADEEGAKVELAGPVPVANGEYHSVRLWLEPHESARDRLGATSSRCGGLGPNCLFFERHEDETIRVQHYLDAEMRVAPFVIAPDTESEILIELVPVWSAVQVGGAVEFQRAFVASGKVCGPECIKDSAEAAAPRPSSNWTPH